MTDEKKNFVLLITGRETLSTNGSSKKDRKEPTVYIEASTDTGAPSNLDGALLSEATVMQFDDIEQMDTSDPDVVSWEFLHIEGKLMSDLRDKYGKYLSDDAIKRIGKTASEVYSVFLRQRHIRSEVNVRRLKKILEQQIIDTISEEVIEHIRSEERAAIITELEAYKASEKAEGRAEFKLGLGRAIHITTGRGVH